MSDEATLEVLRKVLHAFNEHDLDGESIEVSGCDLWTFDEDGKIVRKDPFWKIREPT
jgi:hypothetical protein